MANDGMEPTVPEPTVTTPDWHGRAEVSEVPGLDCLNPGHLLVTLAQPGAFSTAEDQVATATWCLWCGGGVSNEEILEDS